MNCPNCDNTIPEGATLCPECGNSINLPSDVGGEIVQLLALAGGSILFITLLRWFIKTVNWEKVGKFVIEALYQMALSNDVTKIHPRLDQAQSILDSGENYSPEMAAGLACGALESGLRLMIGPWELEDYEDPRGLIDLANILHEQSIISIYDSEKIKNIAVEIRNPTAHGNLIYNSDKVQDAVTWIREFINRKIAYA